MDKFMEFLKNNTAVVAVAAGIVLFIAMNGYHVLRREGRRERRPSRCAGAVRAEKRATIS